MTPQSILRACASQTFSGQIAHQGTQHSDGTLTIQTDLTREECLVLAIDICQYVDSAYYADEVTEDGGWVDVWGDEPDICGEFRVHLVPA